MSTSGYNANNPADAQSRWGAGVYYGVTALVVVVLALAVLGGRLFYARKRRREMRRHIDLERANQARRGEAPGLPTYNEPGTTRVPMPTLAYPDAVYRPNEAHPEAQQDNGLPTYDVVQPPKYDFGANASVAAAALGRPGITSQTSTNSVLQVEMQQTAGQRIYTPLPSPNANASTTQVPMHIVAPAAQSPEPVGQLQDVPLNEPANRN